MWFCDMRVFFLWQSCEGILRGQFSIHRLSTLWNLLKEWRHVGPGMHLDTLLQEERGEVTSNRPLSRPRSREPRGKREKSSVCEWVSRYFPGQVVGGQRRRHGIKLFEMTHLKVKGKVESLSKVVF